MGFIQPCPLSQPSLFVLPPLPLPRWHLPYTVVVVVAVVTMSVYDASGCPNTTVVAVDKDKNSSYAFRWAVNHLDNPIVIAIHVKHKSIAHNANGANIFPPDEDDVANVFGNLRGLCNRKSVQIREAVIDDSDIAKALIEYANMNFVHSIVVGASTKSPLATSIKIFKGHQQDVPTALLKTAPDYSNVYVISKWKVVNARSAVRLMSNAPIPPRQSLLLAYAPYNESENGLRGVNKDSAHEKNNHDVKIPVRDRPRSAGSYQSMEAIEIPAHLRHKSLDERYVLGSMDANEQDLDISFTSDSPKSRASVSQSARDVEAEMRRLRLELKQTMDMYSSACKQAMSAKQQADQIRQWKLEGERKVEEVWLSQEAALAIAEMEKAKAKAALEAAEEARKMAEQEAQRRKDAEMKAKKEAEEKERLLSALAQNDNRYRKYTIMEIEEATEKFSPSNKLGEGGYGPVFKGQLDHTPVAIKLLNPNASQGRKQFNQEVEVLSCIRHPNMVLLLGACPEHGCLVYEFMDNGTLEDRIFRKNNSPPIPWRKRFQIAAEIATALLFLHQTKPEPIVHRDLKPANILLNRNYVSKIADVGLARLVPQSVADSVTHYYMTSAAGTFCYIDPEYQQTGMLTTKSDIYSLGIVLLQLVTAKPAMGLAHLVRMAIEKGKFVDLLDPVVTDWPVEEALAFGKLALSCVELSKKDRPNLATVVLPELNRLREFGSNSHDMEVKISENFSTRNLMLPPPPRLNAKTLKRS